MPSSPRRLPGIYKTYTENYPLRLTPEQRARLEKAAKYADKKISDFLRDAVMARVSEVEEDVRLARHRREEDERADEIAPLSKRLPSWAKGAHIEEQPSPISVEVPAAAPTVIVNNAPTNNQVDHLANYVLGAPNSVERMTREREVEKILKAISDKTEAENLARAIDEKIKATKPKRSLLSWLTG